MKNIILLLLFVPACLGAYDMGLLVDQNVGLGGDDRGIDLSDIGVDYSATVIPRFSFFLGESDSWDVFLSAGITVNYEDEEWSYIPEILRTEVSGRDGIFRIRAGRMPYTDPLYFIVDGLFDGGQAFFDTPAGTFNVGAWYTGLLYKKKAYIIISPEDFISYSTPLDYSEFADTYFASKRMLATLGWEHPSLAEIIRLKFSLISQYDLNDYDNPYHSQYASLKAGILVKQFMFELGGAFQAAEAVKAPKDDIFSIGYAGALGISWALPGAVQHQVSLNGLYSSGKAESGLVAAFVPVTTKEQGNILKAQFSGISVLDLDYSIRIHETLSSGITATYFIRNDLGTYMGYPVPVGGAEDNDGHFLGVEFFSRIIWSPVSDLRMSLGGGIFFPSTGDVDPKGVSQWRVEVGLVLALY